MKTCNNCGFENPDGIHICLRCASSFDKICAACGSSMPAENLFCGKCGARIEGSVSGINKNYNLAVNDLKDHILKNMRALMPTSLASKISQGSYEISGLRREATVLMAELTSGSGEKVAIDSEVIFLANDKIMQLLAEVVYKYEGTIDKYSSDGMMALFGVPLNHENDPERAARAALEMQQIMMSNKSKLREDFGIDLQLRIGVNTGSVITGSMNNQHHLEYNVVGNTITMASQLKETASPGQTLVSFSTYQRTNPILKYQNIDGVKQAHDLGAELCTYELLGLVSNPGRTRGLPGNLHPMIGRDDDIKKLQDAFQLVLESKSDQIVMCSGEPGIGKSRLIAEFQSSLFLKKVQFFQGTCAVYMRITPYRVIANLLRCIIGVSEMDPQHVQIAALRDYIGACELDPGDVTPALLHILNLPQTDPVIEVRFRFLEPSMLQKETFLSLRMFLLAVARISPIVLAFDDLHWVDKVSAQFLEYFCRSLDNTSVLLVLIARNFKGSEALESIHSAAKNHKLAPVEIHLKSLTESEVHIILENFISENSPRADAIKAKLTERAGGNPYFIEELIRFLIDNHGLVLNDQHYDLLPNADQLLEQIPGTLQDILLARLDQLSDPLLDLIQKASILNNFFTINLIGILRTEEKETLNLYLDELVEREFFIRARIGNEEGYLFKHQLIQSTVYRTLLKRDLRKYHFLVAVAVESGQIWYSGDKNEIIAYHYEESNEPEKAIPYLIEAAENAENHFANSTAMEYYQKALSLVNQYFPEENAKLNKLRIGLGRALKLNGDFTQATKVLNSVLIPFLEKSTLISVSPVEVEAFIEMADLHIREGDTDKAVRFLHDGLDLIGDDGRNSNPKLWRRLMERLAWVNFRQGNVEEAYNLADLALLGVTTLEDEDPITFASLYNTLGGIYWNHTRYTEAVESVNHSLSIYRRLGYHWGIAASLNNLGVLYFSMNKWPEALNCLEQANKLRMEYGFDPERPINLKNIGEVLIAMGDYDSAHSVLITGLELSQKFGVDLAESYLELGLCRLALLQEDFEEAEEHLLNSSRYIDLSSEVSDRNADFHMLQSQIFVNEKKFDLAIESAEKALSLSEKGDFSDEKVDALRFLGIVHCAISMFEQAENEFYESIQMSQRSGDRYGEAKGLYEIAVMFMVWAQKEPSMWSHYIRQAEKSLDRALIIFESLGAKRDLNRAQMLLLRILSIDNTAGNQQIKNDPQIELVKFRNQMGTTTGEWYQAVILYACLIPRGEESEELIFETINYLMPFLIVIPEENGGKVIREQNGFMVIFGAPIAHEDDTERAVDSAIQMINFYSEIYRQTELPVMIQLGISMGKIVAGVPSSSREQEMVAAGEPIQLAKQLAELAGSSHALVSGTVRNIASYRYEFNSAPSHVIDRVGSQAIYQLKGVREQILPVRGLIGLKTPFVGRDKEFKDILTLSSRLDMGAGGLVWLEGDAGIGKSRMLNEFATWATAEGKKTWIGECTNRHADVPFGLFSGMLSREFDIHPNYSHAQIYYQIDKRIETWPSDLKDTCPYLEFLLGVQPREGYLERLLALDPEQLRRQIFVAIHRIVTRLAEIQPLIFFLDDLQWIDAISADLLLYLSYLIGNHRVLIICAHRENEKGLSDATLTQIRNLYPDFTLNIHLEPLSVDTCYMLLEKFLFAAKLNEAVKSLIVHQSGGNPYYLEEFVRMLVEQDYLRMVHGHLEVNQVLEINKLNIPNSLETLIRARVDSLPISARYLIQIASIIGYPFTRELIQKISEREDINPYLELLHSRGMLSLIQGSQYWQICHPIIEQVVYNSVLRAERKLLHKKIGNILEMFYQENEGEHIDELAYHFSKSDDSLKALNYLILAGERALFRHATEAALSSFSQASDLVNSVPNLSDIVRWRIRVGLGEVHLLAGNYTASLAVLHSGLDLVDSPELSAAQCAGIFRRLGDTLDKLGEHEKAIEYLNKALEILKMPANAVDEAELARIHARLGWSLFHQGNLDNAKEEIERAVVYAHSSNNLGALAVTENYLGGICLRQGNLDLAAQHTRRAMSYWEEVGYTWGVATTLSNLGILEVSGGNISAALANFEASLSLQQNMGDVEGLAIAYNNLGQFLRDQGDLVQSEGHFRSSLLLTSSLHMTFHKATSYMGLTQVLIFLNKFEEASEQLNHARVLVKEMGTPDLLAEMFWTEAELELAQRNFLRAETLSLQSAAIAAETGNGILLSAALQISAYCQIQQGHLENARQILEQARQAAEAGAGELELGRVNAKAVLLNQLAGDQEKAKVYYIKAKEIFEKLNAKRDLKYLESLSS